MSEEKTVVSVEKNYIKENTPVRCQLAGEFVKDGKTVKYPNCVKVGNGFKQIAQFKSQEQIRGFMAVARLASFQQWIREMLPESYVETEEQDEPMEGQ